MSPNAALRRLEKLVRDSDIADHPRAAIEAEDCLSVLWKLAVLGERETDGDILQRNEGVLGGG